MKHTITCFLRAAYPGSRSPNSPTDTLRRQDHRSRCCSCRSRRQPSGRNKYRFRSTGSRHRPDTAGIQCRSSQACTPRTSHLQGLKAVQHVNYQTAHLPMYPVSQEQTPVPAMPSEQLPLWLHWFEAPPGHSAQPNSLSMHSIPIASNHTRAVKAPSTRKAFIASSASKARCTSARADAVLGIRTNTITRARCIAAARTGAAVSTKVARATVLTGIAIKTNVATAEAGASLGIGAVA